jgi:hypothetical protein
MDTRTYYGAFNMIVAEVENLNVQVNFETYRRQHNPIEDQLGSAIHAFKTNEDVKGRSWRIRNRRSSSSGDPAGRWRRSEPPRRRCRTRSIT